MSPKQIDYARVEGEEHSVDVHEDSSSLTDVEEGAPLSSHHTNTRSGLEKTWEAPRRRQSRWRKCCSSMLLQGLVNTVLLLLVLALLVDRSWDKSQKRYGQFEGGGDITGFTPPVAQQITTFVPDMSFNPENSTDFFTKEVQDKWLSIVPKGLGYLKVKDPSQYNNLPHPLHGYNGIVFTTSVTHQLHCLYNILEVYSSMQSGKHIPKQMHGHLPHCFEYLRQSIMCCGDTALEGQHTTFPDGVLGSDGWDAKHVCKDYGQVMSFLEENRADDKDWI